MPRHRSRLPCLPLWSCHGMVALRWIIMIVFMIVKITNLPSYELALLFMLMILIKILIMIVLISICEEILLIMMIMVI